MTVSVVLRVRKRYYDAIVNGTKNVEYRKDSSFWLRRLARLSSTAMNPEPAIAVFICGKRVHRRKITRIDHVPTPKGFSEQGRKDVPTMFCWAIHLGETV